MPSFSRNEVVLVRVILSNQAGAKIRPAVIINGPHISRDLLIVPMTSKTTELLPGEFVLADWKKAGLNVATAAKRGLYTVADNLVLKTVGVMSQHDMQQLESALRMWIELN